jgi:hypothetical protein
VWQRLAEPAPADALSQVQADQAAIEGLLVSLFREAHVMTSEEIALDLDATDDLIHGNQEGRFSGYYGGYCYLPLSHFLRCRRRSPVFG